MIVFIHIWHTVPYRTVPQKSYLDWYDLCRVNTVLSPRLTSVVWNWHQWYDWFISIFSFLFSFLSFYSNFMDNLPAFYFVFIMPIHTPEVVCSILKGIILIFNFNHWFLITTMVVTTTDGFHPVSSGNHYFFLLLSFASSFLVVVLGCCVFVVYVFFSRLRTERRRHAKIFFVFMFDRKLIFFLSGN